MFAQISQGHIRKVFAELFSKSDLPAPAGASDPILNQIGIKGRFDHYFSFLGRQIFELYPCNNAENQVINDPRMENDIQDHIRGESEENEHSDRIQAKENQRSDEKCHVPLGKEPEQSKQRNDNDGDRGHGEEKLGSPKIVNVVFKIIVFRGQFSAKCHGVYHQIIGYGRGEEKINISSEQREDDIEQSECDDCQQIGTADAVVVFQLRTGGEILLFLEQTHK